MTFEALYRYLLSLGNEVSTMKLGLGNIRKLLAALEHPEKNYFKVQIAGTNGKGSACAFLDAICLDAGIRTGRFTSPHLTSITERIKIAGDDISEEDFARYASRVRETSERLVMGGVLESVPTYFEQVTAAALLAFAEAGVELAILETGLGGRFDATTAANAEIAAITAIGLDHQQYLGNTLAEIAAEKAAIIHAGSKAAAVKQSETAEKAILARCREAGVEPVWATTDITTEVNKDADGLPALETTFRTSEAVYPGIALGLLGRHQIGNASLAIAVAELLQTSGSTISTGNIRRGLANATHPGRLEYIGSRYLLDGAHNIDGARALAAYLDEFEERPVTMVFGTMSEKDVREITAVLLPKAEKVIFTAPGNSRALPANELLSMHALDDAQTALDIKEALEIADRSAGEDGLILVTGSLYLVGEARGLLLHR